MNSTVLVGSMVNAKAVGYKSVEIAENEIDVVMAGYKGNFALEDFFGSRRNSLLDLRQVK